MVITPIKPIAPAKPAPAPAAEEEADDDDLGPAAGGSNSTNITAEDT